MNSIFMGNISLYSLLLIPFFPISLLLIIKPENNYFIVGIGISLLFLVICYVFPNRKSDELFVYSNLAFFSNAKIGDKYLKKYLSPSSKNLIFLLLALGIFHSFGQAFGFWGNNNLATSRIGERIGKSQDIIELIPFTIPFLLLFLKKQTSSFIKLIILLITTLAILRVISTGTRGISLAVIFSVILYLFFFAKSILSPKRIIMALFIVVIVGFLARSQIISQIKTITKAYVEYNIARGTDTGIARFVEAKNDFETFKENPIIGGGFYKAGQKYNSLNEPSYGHFFLTGLLGRVGFIGTFFFLSAYFFYFSKIYKTFYKDKELNFFLWSTFCIVATYFILGNPMYLSRIWPVLPIFWSIILFSYNEKNSYPLPQLRQ